MAYGLILASVAALLALAAAVRLAPSDPAKWHVALDNAAPAMPGPCALQIRLVPKGASASCLLADEPASVLTRLDTMALATPRTLRLAGTGQQGRITWVSRSKLMRFPDYITAEARPTPQGTRLDIFSRQRFGDGDRGVNAARLKAWLTALDQNP